MAKDLDTELRDFSGYLSGGEFDARYLDEGYDKDLSNVIVVDNLPAGVPESKFQKLYDFVRKIYSGFGTIVTLHMPVNADKLTEGFAFVEFETPAMAELAQKSTQGYAFDKLHVLTVMRYPDFLAYAGEPDVFSPPELPAFKEPESLLDWLLDATGRDQFLVRSNVLNAEQRSEETEVFWAEKGKAPSKAYGGEHQKNSGRYWTERQARWSSKGSYVATFHPQGLALWGGSAFSSIGRFAHADANEAIFSPDERFLATWNGHTDNKDPARALVVWDVRTQTELRSFKQLRQTDNKADCAWSQDGKYLSRLGLDPTSGKELIQIYEAPSFNLLDSRSVPAPGARDPSWCPAAQNLIAWWAPETDNKPASVSVMRIPSRAVKAVQLYGVEHVELVWHPQGDFLAVVAAKKKKKAGSKPVAVAAPTKGAAGAVAAAAAAAAGAGAPGTAAAAGSGSHPGYTVQILRLKSKEISVEALEIKDKVVELQWEPKGTRFSVVTGEGPNRHTVSFYNAGERSVSHLFDLTDKPANSVVWSPKGELAVLAGLQQLGGQLEFYDVEHKKSLQEPGAASPDHMQATGIAWDPSGRTVATWKNQPYPQPGRAVGAKEASNNGYILWNAHGSRITENISPSMKLYQFSWRPRPESSLSEEEQAAVLKELRSYMKKYADMDRIMSNMEMVELLHKLQKLREQHRAIMTELHSGYLKDKPSRAALGLRDADEPLATDTLVEQFYEVLLEEKVEKV